MKSIVHFEHQIDVNNDLEKYISLHENHNTLLIFWYNIQRRWFSEFSLRTSENFQYTLFTRALKMNVLDQFDQSVSD